MILFASSSNLEIIGDHVVVWLCTLTSLRILMAAHSIRFALPRRTVVDLFPGHTKQACFSSIYFLAIHRSISSTPPGGATLLFTCCSTTCTSKYCCCNAGGGRFRSEGFFQEDSFFILWRLPFKVQPQSSIHFSTDL